MTYYDNDNNHVSADPTGTPPKPAASSLGADSLLYWFRCALVTSLLRVEAHMDHAKDLN